MAIAAAAGTARAQVVRDGSLGSGPQALAGPAIQITPQHGKQVGSNLFHSFRQFDLAKGDVATFTGPASVANVLSRVTGGASSSINGTIGCSIPNANVYLINPAGVVFGPDAVLNVSGSFAVTTADVLKLADGGTFHADPAADSVLTSAAPAAFGFLAARPTSVTSSARRFETPKGNTMSVVAGEVRIVAGAFHAVNGRLNVVAVGSPGEVGLDAASSDPAAPITLSGFERLGDVAVETGASFGAHPITDANFIPTGEDGPPGSAAIRAENLVVGGNLGVSTGGETPGGSLDIGLGSALEVEGGIVAATNAGGGAGASINVRARDVRLIGGSGIVGLGFESATGEAAPVSLRADSLELSAGAAIASLSAGQGGTGIVDVFVTGLMDLSGAGAGIFSLPNGAGSPGHAGDVNVRGGEIRLRGGASIFSETGSLDNTGASGNAGDVDVAADSILIDPQGSPARDVGIRSRALGVLGNAGSVRVSAREALTILGGATIQSTSITAGNTTGTPHLAGSVDVAADRLVIDSGAAEGATGVLLQTVSAAPGELRVSAGDLELSGAGQIISGTFGTAAGAPALITASRSILLEGRSASQAGVFTQSVATGGVPSGGEGGSIVIDAPTVELRAGGVINTNSNSPGQGGDVTVRAGEVKLIGHLAQVGSLTEGAGDAGDVQVVTRGRVEIDGQGGEAYISSLTQASATGRTGNVTVDAAGDIAVLQGGSIRATTFSSARGGDVTVTGNNVLVDGRGAAGDQASIDSDPLPGSTGAGGTVRVTGRQAVSVRRGAKISSRTSGAGAAGDVFVRAPLVEVDGRGADGVEPLLTTITSDAANFTGRLTPTRVPGGNGGSVTVEADRVEVFAGGVISANTRAEGQAGSVFVAGTESVLIDGTGAVAGSFPAISSLATNFDLTGITEDGETLPPVPGAGPGGDGGAVNVTAGHLQVLNNGEVSAASQDDGDGGSVFVSVKRLTISGTQAEIDTSTLGTGAGGALAVTVTGEALLEGARGGIFAESFSAGNAGSITFLANGLTIRNAASISGTTFNAGRGGTVTVDVKERMTIDGTKGPLSGPDSGAFAGISVQTQGAGAGGELFVRAGELSVLNRGLISASSVAGPDNPPSGLGAPGNVNLDVGQLQLSSEGGVRSSSAAAEADAGDVSIHATGDVRLTRGAFIAAEATLANAGTIAVTAGDSIELTDDRPGVSPPAALDPTPANTRITAAARNGGGGNIKLTAPRRIVLSNSLITAESLNSEGAKIDLDPQVVVLNKSVINGRAAGEDVPVTVVADRFILSTDSAIESDAVTAPVEVDVARALARLPAALAGAQARLEELCGVRFGGQVSSFLRGGRGGLPPEPAGWAPSADAQRQRHEGVKRAAGDK